MSLRMFVFPLVRFIDFVAHVGTCMCARVHTHIHTYIRFDLPGLSEELCVTAVLIGSARTRVCVCVCVWFMSHACMCTSSNWISVMLYTGCVQSLCVAADQISCTLLVPVCVFVCVKTEY